MRVRVLGAHNAASATTAPVSLLVDDVICIDAGAVHTALTFEEQRRVRAVLLTHRHFDHIHGVPLLAINTAGHGLTRIYGLGPVLAELREHLINGVLYPTFLPGGNLPSLDLRPIEPFEEIEIEGHTAIAVPVEHGVPAVGYEVRSPDGRSMFYTGDTGGGLAAAWEHVTPDALFCEVTYPNAHGGASKHLTPARFEAEMATYLGGKPAPARVITVHMTPWLEEAILAELAEVSRRLGVEIEAAYEGMVVEI